MIDRCRDEAGVLGATGAGVFGLCIGPLEVYDGLPSAVFLIRLQEQD
jgi:hypothetical protein